MRLTLTRKALQPSATGRLVLPGLECYTVEDAWNPSPEHPWGQPFKSCIPPGLYQLVPHKSAKFGDCWAIVNPSLGVYRWPADVPNGRGRYTCLIHTGNSDEDVEGCIAVGMRSGIYKNRPGVFDSGVAMRKVRAVLGVGSTHELEIRHL